MSPFRVGLIGSGGISRTYMEAFKHVAEAEVEVLLSEAYEAQVDAVFRRIIKDVWGLHFERLTPSWRWTWASVPA